MVVPLLNVVIPLQVLEDEMGQIRMKLIEKERECERLHAEISAGGKKKTLTKSRRGKLFANCLFCKILYDPGVEEIGRLVR